jgi:NADPH-dependent ferric siderophore reductase
VKINAGRVFLFAAGEAGDIRPLRRRREGVERLVTGYWKRGTAGGEVDLDEDDA